MKTTFEKTCSNELSRIDGLIRKSTVWLFKGKEQRARLMMESLYIFERLTVIS